MHSMSEEVIEQRAPFWKRGWFILGLAILLIALFFFFQPSSEESVTLAVNASLEQEIAEVAMSSLESNASSNINLGETDLS